MNYVNIVKNDFNNNLDGIGVTLFVSGCEHHCPGCQNKETWDFKAGIPFDKAAMGEIIEALEYADTLTISGGDPLNPKNIDTVLKICKTVRTKMPNIRIWIYTGYTMKTIPYKCIFSCCDVIVDGPFIEELRDPETCLIFGSANQHINVIRDHKYVTYNNEREYYASEYNGGKNGSI